MIGTCVNSIGNKARKIIMSEEKFLKARMELFQLQTAKSESCTHDTMDLSSSDQRSLLLTGHLFWLCRLQNEGQL